MCVLRVSGKRFDPVRFLADSELEPYSVFRTGEPRTKTHRANAVYETSGFLVDVSDSSWDKLSGQVGDAIAFLQRHQRTLARLREIPEVEDARLDFPIDLRIDRKNVAAQFDYFPPELVSLAGELGLGLELSIYPPDFEQLARDRDSQSERPGARRKPAGLRHPAKDRRPGGRH